jgi:hypothetical protein
MTQATPNPIDQYPPRARLAALIARCELDPLGFGTEVRANPTAALQQIGFSSAEASALSSAQAAGADDPAAALGGGCFDTSCIVSLCPPSCFVSAPPIPGVCDGGGGGCGFLSIF